MRQPHEKTPTHPMPTRFAVRMLAAAGHPIRGPSSTESAPSIANWGTSFRGPAPVHAVAALVSGSPSSRRSVRVAIDIRSRRADVYGERVVVNDLFGYGGVYHRNLLSFFWVRWQYFDGFDPFWGGCSS